MKALLIIRYIKLHDIFERAAEIPRITLGLNQHFNGETYTYR